MGTGSCSIAVTEMGDLHHEVTVKWAAASNGGNQMLSLTKPVSLKERPMERIMLAICAEEARHRRRFLLVPPLIAISKLRRGA